MDFNRIEMLVPSARFKKLQVSNQSLDECALEFLSPRNVALDWLKLAYVAVSTPKKNRQFRLDATIRGIRVACVKVLANAVA
ncbi:hypothetical protein EGY31_14355 [Burkholderia multivorans]|nr:hypothetical protein EGY31_14355 [Burkholderia multivorans]